MFKLTSAFEPTGDQPEAIKELTQGLLDEVPGQVLLGVTGSGKTFTIANVIQEVQRPTLILSHNKTLAARLYGEFKAFSPKMRWSTLYLTTTITNRRLTYPPPTRISKKIS